MEFEFQNEKMAKHSSHIYLHWSSMFGPHDAMRVIGAAEEL